MTLPRKIRLFRVADTPEEHSQGLMFVRDIEPETGMLFRFKSPRVLNFWMKNTYVPLDIAFADSSGRIVKTETMIPMSLRSVSSGRPCSMALEVPAGTFKDVEGSRLSVDGEWAIIDDDDR
jgi:uncharacterized membrane protein (UPF0127 family)